MFGIYASLWKRGHFQDVFWGFERNLNVIIQYLSFQKTSAENFTNCQKKKKKTLYCGFIWLKLYTVIHLFSPLFILNRKRVFSKSYLHITA